MARLFNREFFEKSEPKDRATEVVWQHSVQYLAASNNEIILPFAVVEYIGEENTVMLQKRLSLVFPPPDRSSSILMNYRTLLAAPVVQVKDNSISSMRLLPAPGPSMPSIDLVAHGMDAQ